MVSSAHPSSVCLALRIIGGVAQLSDMIKHTLFQTVVKHMIMGISYSSGCCFLLHDCRFAATFIIGTVPGFLLLVMYANFVGT